MEDNKYQMFFPCSSSISSTMAAANFSSSANHANNNSFFDHQGGRDQSSNGGLQGLLRSVTDDQNQFGGETSSTSAHQDQYNPPPSSSNMAAADAAAGHGKTSVVKAGEKKMRKPKHAFQTRSQVDILDDGYRWRKYGQKAVKNNKFPRSYYRCTYQGCNVKKQVQRLTKDEGVVVTTYEGMHTHPIEKPSDNFDHILSQMQIYTPF